MPARGPRSSSAVTKGVRTRVKNSGKVKGSFKSTSLRENIMSKIAYRKKKIAELQGEIRELERRDLEDVKRI